MMDFFNSDAVKLATLVVVLVFFSLVPLIQVVVSRKLPEELREPYKDAAKDAYVKTLLMFSGAAFFGVISYVKGDVSKAVTQSLFALCLFASLNTFWTLSRVKSDLRKAESLSNEGQRGEKISQINWILSKRVINHATLSFVVGLGGCLYVAFLYDQYALGWIWFLAFITTGPAVNAARWADGAKIASSKMAGDAEFGV